MEKEEDSLSSTPRLVLFIVTFSMYSRPSLFSTSQTRECPSVHKAPPQSKTVHTACQHQFRFCPSPFCDLLGAPFLLFFYTVSFLVPPPSSALPCPDVPWNAPTTATKSHVTHIHVHTTNAHFYHGKYMQKKDLCSELTVCRPCVKKMCTSANSLLSSVPSSVLSRIGSDKLFQLGSSSNTLVVDAWFLQSALTL